MASDWTPDQDAAVLSGKDPMNVARALGRDVDSVIKRRRTLAGATSTSRGNRWTKDDDATLSASVANGLTDAEMAGKMNRTPAAISDRLRRLNLRGLRSTAWTPAEDALLRAQISAGKDSKEIAELMGRGASAVERRLRRLGVSLRGNPERLEQMLRDRWTRAASVGEVTTALKISRDAALAMAARLSLPELPLGDCNQGQPRPVAPRGISAEQRAWAERNAGHPEAALIMAMASEKRRRVMA